MHSPLPDSSALEAGILEDDQPSQASRLSRVQDNVRNLLIRTSVFGSVKSSPTTTPTHPPPPALRTNSVHVPLSSIYRNAHTPASEVLPSPASHRSATTPPARYAEMPQVQERSLFPPIDISQRVAPQSAVFNSRAVAALNHPDLSHPSMTDLSQQKAQHKRRGAWKRSKSSTCRRRAARRAAGSRGILCLLASLLLAALVATYVSIATTESGLTTTFHILFVLGICLATIVFAHSVIRLFFVGRRSRNKPLFVAVSRHGHGHAYGHRHHRPGHSRSDPRLRQMPCLSTNGDPFVPARPIPVSLSSDDIRCDTNVAQPTAGADRGVSVHDWDKNVSSVPNPPPAYGRWRGSVRADPGLLHWQPVHSPVSPGTPVLPSPTYEEVLSESQRDHNESPPSYRTRDSPARRRELREARAGIARSVVGEPEMVEARNASAGAGAGNDGSVGMAM